MGKPSHGMSPSLVTDDDSDELRNIVIIAAMTDEHVIFTTIGDTASKVCVMRSRKQLRETMPDMYINEDLTRARATLLYKAGKAKREKRIFDCWSFDGRIVIKDVRGKVHTIGNEVELAALCG